MSRFEKLMLAAALVTIILLLSNRRIAALINRITDNILPETLPGEEEVPGAAGTPGAPGAPGAPGGYSDLSAVAEALKLLAAGVQVPNIQTEVKSVSSGRSELVPRESAKRIVVCAYAVTTDQTTSANCEFWSSSSAKLWALKLTPVAGSTGANLGVSWPSHLFATNTGENLEFVASAQALVSVTYWRE